jgi:hypothetical protein
MKKIVKKLTFLVLTLIFTACNNYFHDLIPPDDDRILTFEIDGQLSSADISDNTITATVGKDVSVHNLIPRISVSREATLIPVTLDYVRAAFPSADLTDVAMKLIVSNDIFNTIKDLLKANPNFNIPELTIPIDFTGPVTMIVVGGQGSMRQYTVNVFTDTGEPRLINIRFSKYDNPELVSDALCMVDEKNSAVYANASYPAEMSFLNYELVPSFVILGDSFEVDEIPVTSGSTGIQFTPGLGTKTKIITITRDGITKTYSLMLVFTEDPDTIRSITDFRFNKMDNSGIAANAVASIINTDNTGTISVQVFYSGVKPLTLTPHFISPGDVSVGGVTHTSGVNSSDFSSPFEYHVVSRNGMYTRIYTVKTEFINIADITPHITSFRLSAALNAELVQDAVGMISDGLILIDSYYGGLTAPTYITPEFSAEGIVTVFGSVQVSGASAQDFTRQIKYTVTNPEYPTLKLDYWVQCRMIRDTSSDASITAFGFYPEDNSGLADEVIGKIDQINEKITIYAPVGSDVTIKTMFPRFTAAGQINVEGTAQVSGVSGRMFDAPVTYTAVSANGANSRSYTVTVRELQSTIYVNSNAFGYGDGTSWENSFRTLKAACEAAALFPEDTPKEIWIAAGTYKPGAAEDGFPLTANTSYIGGFAGYETAKSQRNIAANAVIISGDFGGGFYSKRLFSSADTLNGDLSFDALQFSSASDSTNGGGIYAVLSSQGVLSVTNCSFDNVRASDSGGAVYVRGGGAVISNSAFNTCNSGTVYVQGTTANISDVKFSMCTGTDVVQLDCSGETRITKVNIEDSSYVRLSGNGGKTLEMVSIKRGKGVSIQNSSGNLRINNSDLTDISSEGIYLGNFSGNAEINSLDLRNITSYGIYCGSSPNRIQLSGITANAIGGSYTYAVRLYLTQGAIIFESSSFTNSRGVYLRTNASSPVEVKNINITNITSGDAITVSGGNNASISNVDINDTRGDGLYLPGLSGNVEISRLGLNNIGGYGIYCSGSPNKIQLSNITGNNISNRAVYLYLTQGAIAFESSSFTNSGGVSLRTGTSNLIDVSNISITAVTTGEAIYITGGNHVAIDRVNIYSVQNGRGINIYNTSNSSTIDISKSNIKNCKTGGGIYLYAKTAKISGTTVENVETSYSGGGIYHSNDDANLEIIGCTIKNAKALSVAGGLYFSGNTLTINDTTMELCTADRHGAIYQYNCTSTITNSRFINCTASNNFKIFNSSFAVIRNCEFTHNAALPNLARTESYNVSVFGNNGGNFENCTFTNLKGNMPSGQNYLLNSWEIYPPYAPSGGGSDVGHVFGGGNLILKKCTFNLSLGSAGIMALYGGQQGGSNSVFINPNNLLMDSVTINDTGVQQPLIWLCNSPDGTSTPGTFQFKANNKYNGTLLNTLTAINSMATSGVLYLTQGAMPVIVP